MGAEWLEREDGVLFTYSNKNDDCVWSRLEMLILDGLAKETKDGILIPSESVVLLSVEDCELFDLPSLNPYRLFIRAKGDLGHKDLRYIVEVLQPNGLPFINPVFNGAFLHIDMQTIFRLEFNQYQMLCIANESNQKVLGLDRREIVGYNLVNLVKIQKHAKKSEAKLDNVLSEENNRVIVPDRLSIQFREDENGEICVEPIILEENEDGKLDETGTEMFQEAFDHRAAVQSVYMGKDRTRYVCTAPIKAGLTKVKATARISKEDRERYEKQPKELFSDKIFHFEDIGGTVEKEDNNWLPEEGMFIDLSYSERVKGLSSIQKSIYYGSGHKVDWMQAEGEIEAAEINEIDKDGTDSKEENEPKNLVGYQSAEEGISNEEIDIVSDYDGLGEKKIEKSRPEFKALDIKGNIDIVDYGRKSMARDGRLDTDALQPGINLLDYQKEGVSWMYSSWCHGYNGVLLADDMGLGKTLQTLAFIAELKKGTKTYGGIDKPILIVAPIALLKNWQNEYNKFIAQNIFEKIIPLHGSELKRFETGEKTPNGKNKLEIKLSSNTIGLTTYETLRDYQFSFAEVNWGIIVVDEAQKIKNPSVGVTKAIKAMKYDYTVCLSGTPVENSWVDLWSIMDFVQPAKLGDLKTFKGKYISYLKEMDNDEKTIGRLGEQLKSELDPLFLRRMKKDKLEGIPKKYIYSCPEQMPSYQMGCYVSVLEAGIKHELHPLMTIAKLRDISLHPDLGTKKISAFFEMDADEVINQSAKLKKLFDILEEVRRRKEKVLIFLVSKKMQLILKHLIYEKLGLKILNPVNGDINGIARQRIVDVFNASIGFNVLILSPEAAGVGFTITSANNVVHLSRTWNPAKEDQATDRVYRIGQKREVNVYLPMACHKDLGEGASFDEKLDELLSYKRKLSENVLFPSGDRPEDGMQIFNSLTNRKLNTEVEYNWTIDDVDKIVGEVFEQVVTDLFNEMDEYSAQKTPQSNDYGVDVVVLSGSDSMGLLIQCKHKDDYKQPLGNKGIQEVCAAIQVYQKRYNGIKFTPVVVTNSIRFSDGAKTIAAENHVKLISRMELARMLKEYPVLKKY